MALRVSIVVVFILGSASLVYGLASVIPRGDRLSRVRVAEGQVQYFHHRCDSCHGEHGLGSAWAPSLVGIGSRKSQREIMEDIREPSLRLATGYTFPSAMPKTLLSEAEIEAIACYLLTRF